MVVVGQLFASFDRARGADPDRAVLDLDVAVGPARMVDVSCEVAADAGIDDRAVRQLEAPDMPAVVDVAQFAREAFPVRDLLTRVIDDARVLRDRLRREDAPAMNLRSPLRQHPLLTYSGRVGLVGEVGRVCDTSHTRPIRPTRPT